MRAWRTERVAGYRRLTPGRARSSSVDRDGSLHVLVNVAEVFVTPCLVEGQAEDATRQFGVPAPLLSFRRVYPLVESPPDGVPHVDRDAGGGEAEVDDADTHSLRPTRRSRRHWRCCRRRHRLCRGGHCWGCCCGE